MCAFSINMASHHHRLSRPFRSFARSTMTHIALRDKVWMYASTPGREGSIAATTSWAGQFESKEDD
jgi:hypothetical protein